LFFKEVLYSIILVCMLILWSCEDKQPTSSEDEFVVGEIDFNYIRKDSSLFISARVYNSLGSEYIDSVFFHLAILEQDTSYEKQILFGTLNDNGTDGDIIRGDGTYSRKFSKMFLEDGTYELTVWAEDARGKVTEKVSTTKRVFENLPPGLSLLRAPESFEKGDTLIFEVKAEDPQGLNDILSVRYIIELPTGEVTSDPSWALRDDGRCGDMVAGDGIFTVHQPSNRESKLQGLFIFYFFAEDKQGAHSDTIEAPVKCPGVTIISPNGGECVKHGDTLNIRWESAYIEKLKIEISTDGYSYSVIDTTDASAGQYLWAVPSLAGISETCKIRLSDIYLFSRCDVSDGYFKIGGCP